MLPSPEVVQRDFDHIARTQALRPERLDSYETDLLNRVPSQCRRVLDVGCGIGILSRRLAHCARSVLAVDLSPQMIAIARGREPAPPNVTYRQADIARWALPTAGFDCIVSVATLHHLPFAQALKKLRDALAPGGRLLVLDLYASHGLVDFAWNAVAAMATAPSVLRNLWQSDEDAKAAWRRHAEHDFFMPLDEVRGICEVELPGAVVRRRLRWRYELIWQKP